MTGKSEDLVQRLTSEESKAINILASELRDWFKVPHSWQHMEEVY